MGSSLLERKLRRRGVASAAAVERWRTRIIDGINHAIPLRDTLLQIAEMLAFQLEVEFYWAEIDVQGTIGNFPEASDRSNLEVIEQTVPAHSGASLGKICIGFRSHTAKRLILPETLENAARLAPAAA